MNTHQKAALAELEDQFGESTHWEEMFDDDTSIVHASFGNGGFFQIWSEPVADGPYVTQPNLVDEYQNEFIELVQRIYRDLDEECPVYDANAVDLYHPGLAKLRAKQKFVELSVTA